MRNHENTGHQTRPATTGTGIDVVACPECGAPAEVVDRFDLPSTDGPVEHVKVQCVTRRWFTVPTHSLPVTAPGEEPGRWTSPLI